MIAIAVPVLDGAGRLVAALSFHVFTVRFSIDTALGHLPALHAAAKDQSNLLQE